MKWTEEQASRLERHGYDVKEATREQHEEALLADLKAAEARARDAERSEKAAEAARAAAGRETARERLRGELEQLRLAPAVVRAALDIVEAVEESDGSDEVSVHFRAGADGAREPAAPIGAAVHSLLRQAAAASESGTLVHAPESGPGDVSQSPDGGEPVDPDSEEGRRAVQKLARELMDAGEKLTLEEAQRKAYWQVDRKYAGKESDDE